MAMEREKSLGSEAAKAITDTIIQPETLGKIEMLHQFVDLMERMRALKESGVLDAMVESLSKIYAPPTTKN